MARNFAEKNKLKEEASQKEAAVAEHPRDLHRITRVVAEKYHSFSSTENSRRFRRELHEVRSVAQHHTGY